ncbi:MAG: hypothetical protein GY811_00235 [Myxococcales bacterium]|nr:hypothetical protein [Myxococcales bacterium]
MLFRDVEHQRAYREGSNAVMLEDAVRDIRYSNFGVPIRVLFRLTPVIAPYLQLDWNMLGITGNGRLGRINLCF